jgi:PAS domain S-box-containing protein
MKSVGKTKIKSSNERISSRRQKDNSGKKESELQKAEEALKQKEEMFKWFVESSPIAMALLEGTPPKSKYTNQMFLRLFGYSADDIPDITHWWSLAYPDNHYRKKIMAIWNKRVGRKINSQFEFGPVERVISCKDGSQKTVEFRMVSFGTTHISFGVDLTERKRADEESREKEERFNALYNRSFDCVYIHDFDGRLMDVNLAALNLLGYTKEEAVSMNLGSLLDKNQWGIGQRVIEEIKQTGAQKQLTEYQLRRKDGVEVYIETKASVIYKEGKPYAILGIGRDITERKKAEALLIKREEELKVRTHHLEESNTALNVLLRQRDQDKKDLEEKITANIREMVMPYVEKLKSTSLTDIQKTYLDLVRSHLEDITTPFLQTIKSRFLNFTPTEVRVATLIREGKNSKEIGQVINISERTVEFHRNNIRIKLGIANQKINLRTYLLALP